MSDSSTILDDTLPKRRAHLREKGRDSLGSSLSVPWPSPRRHQFPSLQPQRSLLELWTEGISRLRSTLREVTIGASRFTSARLMDSQHAYTGLLHPPLKACRSPRVRPHALLPTLRKIPTLCQVPPDLSLLNYPRQRYLNVHSTTPIKRSGQRLYPVVPLSSRTLQTRRCAVEFLWLLGTGIPFVKTFSSVWNICL